MHQIKLNNIIVRVRLSFKKNYNKYKAFETVV